MNKYEEVISSSSGLIYMIINKYFNNYDREDLYQVGVIGVIKAYNNYKKNKNTKFSTYAYKYIYGEIYNYINNYKNIKVSKDYIKLYKKINTARSILAQELMKEPTTYELSSFLEIDPYIIDTINNSMTKIDSLDRVLYNDGKEITIFDTISDNKDYYNIDYLLLNEEIDKLESPYKELIYLRYFEDKTQSEVASLLGMNQVEVSRTEKKTLKRIRNNYQNVA
ncbi:MAG: sigma-70 family RNA polymerase sigma factor [Bacilli bacterium]